MSQEAKRTLVLGVGNPLMGDEGVGPRTIEHLLSQFDFPPDVDVIDAGTMGFTMLNVFDGVDLAIVVDAIQGTGHDPGTVLLLDPDSLAPNQVMHSLHDARLPDVLDAAKLIGMEPEVLCVAVQVGEIAHWVLELTPAVDAAIPGAAEAVVGLLRDRGIVVASKDDSSRVTAVEDAAVDAASGPDADPARAVKILRSLRTKGDVDD